MEAQRKARRLEPHDIPPPELTDAVAWQVLVAAISGPYDVNLGSIQGSFVVTVDTASDEPFNEDGKSDPDPKRALILALADALG